ncbi:hypothetical protein IMCC1989_1250 [gamma proteobacterium IMCC1989]|nr:hypothetical protein IMCC1989_1250 [gamma proteobacterium IMCC1989]
MPSWYIPSFVTELRMRVVQITIKPWRVTRRQGWLAQQHYM